MKEEVTVEGRQPVLEALKAGRKIKKIYVSSGSKGDIIKKIENIASKNNISVKRESKETINKIAQTDVHQGVVAIGAPLKYVERKELLQKAERLGEAPLILALDHLKDPQNFGSIIRTADAAGVHGIIIPMKRSVSVTTSVGKASAGAVEHVLIARSNISQALDYFRSEGCWIIGSDSKSKDIYFDFDMCVPLVIVIGSEGEGLKRLTRDKCDILLRLPMRGKVNSLNAANAASILLYEVVRQRLSV